MRLIFPIGIFIASICIAVGLVLVVDTSALTYWAAQQKRVFQNAMASSLRALQAGDGMALWSLCSLTFAYGFVHAIGPGHGKVLLGAALVSHSTLASLHSICLLLAPALGCAGF